jgi:hypothetical protein
MATVQLPLFVRLRPARQRIARQHGICFGEMPLQSPPMLAAEEFAVGFTLFDFRNGAFAINAAGLAYQLMSASVRKRPTCGITAK